VVTAFTQWYRVMVNRCSPRIIEVSAIVALATAYMALESVAEQDVLPSAVRVVKPAVFPAPLAIVTGAFFEFASLLGKSRSLALLAIRRRAESRRVFNRLSAFTLPWFSPVLVALVTAKPRRTCLARVAASLTPLGRCKSLPQSRPVLMHATHCLLQSASPSD
jgi:hypothetical protein